MVELVRKIIYCERNISDCLWHEYDHALRNLSFVLSSCSKKKRQSMLNSIPGWQVCSSDFNKTDLWQISTFFWKELGLLKEFSKFFFCAWLSYIRTEQNSRWVFFLKKMYPFTLVVNKIDIKVGIGMLKSHIWAQLNIMVYSIIFTVFLSVL